MTATQPLQTSIRTDTATLAIFDATRLRHRLHDDPDWWSIPSDEIEEINRGNVLFVSTSVDGDYLISVFREAPPANVLPVAVQAVVACDSGSLFVVAGEYVSSGGFEPETTYGGLNLELPRGTYRVTVVHLIPYCLDVFLEAVEKSEQNDFENSPHVPWPRDDT